LPMRGRAAGFHSPFGCVEHRAANEMAPALRREPGLFKTDVVAGQRPR
jgi:hypothetical protein